MKRFLLLSYLFVVFIISSCEQNYELLETSNNKEVSIDLEKATPDPSVHFDWENVNTINYKGSSIPLPWNSTNTTVPLDIKPDIKYSEGWRLLYNDFPYAVSDPFFALYNIYTGIMRVYLLPTNYQFPNNSFSFGIGVNTATGYSTSALNFSWAMSLPANSKSSNPYLYKIPWCSTVGQAPLSLMNNYWYCSEFEFAYDPAITSLTRDKLELAFATQIIQKSYVETTGTINGTINGTFTMPKSNEAGGIISALGNGISLNNLFEGKVSIPAMANIKTYLLSLAAKQVSSTLKTLYTNAAANLIGNRLRSDNKLLDLMGSLIYTPGSSTPGYINLDFKAQTTTSGTITTGYSGPLKNSLIFPGIQAGTSTIGGLLPYYNKNLGVWNINTQPTVEYGNAYWDEMEPYRYQDYSLLPNSFSVTFNPEVQQTGAICRVVSKELIFYDSNGMLYNWGGTLINTDGGDTYKGTSFGLIWGGSPRPSAGSAKLSPRGSWRVRVTIGIKPTGFTDEILLIKEFVPKLVYNSML